MSDKKLPLENMTYRQWLIGMAFQGILASDTEGNIQPEGCAKATINYVDALLKQLEEEKRKRKISDTL